MISKVMSHAVCVLVGATVALIIGAYYKVHFSREFDEKRVNAYISCVHMMTTYGTRKSTMRKPEDPPRPAQDIATICGTLPEKMIRHE